MNNRRERLTKYAAQLQYRIKADVPKRHISHPEAFKQMLEIDLKKTLAKIEELKLNG